MGLVSHLVACPINKGMTHVYLTGALALSSHLGMTE